MVPEALRICTGYYVNVLNRSIVAGQHGGVFEIHGVEIVDFVAIFNEDEKHVVQNELYG